MAIRIDGGLQRGRGDHGVAKTGKMLERPADGSIKPPRVIAPAKPGVVLNEARGGVLKGMRIEFLGVRCVCEFVGAVTRHLADGSASNR